MRIYTEVNYIWKDDKLVQTDSKSYEYSGEVTRCDTRRGGPSWAKFNIPHSHWVAPTINELKPKGGTLADTANVISEGVKSGTTAVKAGYDKMRDDNPDPNLNVQTPGQLFDKGRQVLHDAATNIKRIWDRNRPSYGGGDQAEDWEKGGATSNPLLEEDTGLGTRSTASGGMYGASGRSTSGRRSIEMKKNLAPSLITQHKQRRLSA